MGRMELCAIPIALLCLAFPGALPAQKAGEVRLPEGTRISLRLNDYLSTKLNSEGDVFTAEVTAPVSQGDRVIIPKGSIICGSISRVVRPGRFRGRGLMYLVFDSVRIPGKGSVPLTASLASIDSEGNAGVKTEGNVEGGGSKGKDAGQVAKPGLAGAGIGALIGGGQGAAIGAGVGAAVGVATVLTTRGKDLELRRGSALEIILNRPLLVPGEGETSSGRNRD